MPDLVNGAELLKQLRAELQNGSSADLAVAFWGSGAAEALGIQENSEVRIVCNLLSGGTNPGAIERLLKLGADVRQLNDLHAKIGVVGGLSFVGSSNISTNGLGAEGGAAKWREANIVYDEKHPEICRMFAEFWNASSEISTHDLQIARNAWAERRKSTAVVAARVEGGSLVDVLRNRPEDLDALNVRMVVYDEVTDRDDLALLGSAEEYARRKYGESFEVYWDWPSMTEEASSAYLVSFEWPARGRIARGLLLQRDAGEFPDFGKKGHDFHAAYKVNSIKGIGFGSEDKRIIRDAFHAYVLDGEKGEPGDERAYNFPISELRDYLPSPD